MNECQDPRYRVQGETTDAGCPYCEISRLSRDLSEITTANMVIRYERDDALSEVNRLKEEVTRLRQYEDAVTSAADGSLLVWNLMDTNSTVIANDYWQSHLTEIDRLKAELERVREKVLWPPNPQSWTVIRITELEKLERQLAEARAEVDRLRKSVGEWCKTAEMYRRFETEARQEAAREVLEMIAAYPSGEVLIRVSEHIKHKFKLEG